MPEYSLTQHRGKWALSWRDGQRRLRLSTGTADRGLAESRAGQLWQRINTAPSERVGDLWPLYIKDRIRDGVRANRFKAHWTALGPVFGHRLCTAITKEDCRAYHAERQRLGYAASTIRTDMEMLRACLRWHLGAAAPSVWIAPASAPRQHWLTKEQARTLVDLADTPHIKLFLILGLSTGARAGAILDLTWDRVDFQHGAIDFRPSGRVQTNKRRTVVPMNATARSALERAYPARLTDNVIEYNGKPIASVKTATEALAARTGIAFSPHVLRHTCAVWMAQADVPMQKISQYLGHTSLRMTSQIYATYSPSWMLDAGEAATF